MKKVILLVFCYILFLPSVQAVDLDYEHGHFEKIPAPPIEGWHSTHTKLKNGKILFVYDDAYVFDPKTDKFYEGSSKLNYFIQGHIRISSTVLLDDGQVLLIVNATNHPLYLNLYYAMIIYSNILPKDAPLRKKYPSYFDYQKIPIAEHERLLLPYIKQNKELWDSYNSRKWEYKVGNYAFIYNFETGQTKPIGKFNIRRSLGASVLLSDGNVLFAGGEAEGDVSLSFRNIKIEKKMYILADRVSQFEIYNPKTDKFTLLNISKTLGDAEYAFLLHDGRVFIHAMFDTCIYDPKNGTILSLPELQDGINFLELADGTIIYNTLVPGEFEKDRFGRYNYRAVMGYDPVTNKVKYLGKLHIVRDGDFDMLLLPDGNVMVTGGSREVGTNLMNWHFVYDKRVEIFNPKTGKSKLIAKMKSGKDHFYSVLLDDGRILFYSEFAGAELYIPKGYIKEK